jgi:hypothetical protein
MLIHWAVSLDRFIHSIDSLFNPTIENSDTTPEALGSFLSDWMLGEYKSTLKQSERNSGHARGLRIDFYGSGYIRAKEIPSQSLDQLGIGDRQSVVSPNCRSTSSSVPLSRDSWTRIAGRAGLQQSSAVEGIKPDVSTAPRIHDNCRTRLDAVSSKFSIVDLAIMVNLPLRE